MDVKMEPRGVCCCCLEVCNYRSIWKTYTWLENSEIYGNMLNDIFGVDYSKIGRPGVEDQICESCINKLRHTTMYRKQVLQSYALLQNQLHLEIIKTEVHVDGEDVKPVLDDMNLEDMCCLDDVTADAKMIALPEITNKRQFKKQRKEKRLATKSILRNRHTTPSKGRPTKDGPTYREMNRQYRHNVSLLLQHTTICPFNSNQTYFMCIYCRKQYVNFDQLKDHVFEMHGNVDHTKYQYKIEKRNCKRMKAEVSNIQCRLCTKQFDNLESIIDHLTKTHDLDFVYDVSKPLDCVVGFELSGGKYKCSICKEEFQYFKTLTIHVNSHFTDFVCDICGKNFLGQGKLTVHKKSHNKTHVRCQYCQKVLAASALKQHMKYIHLKRTYICSVCKEVFDSVNARMDHLVEVHDRPRPNLSCDICYRCFNSKTSLQYHIRTSHLNEPETKHPCPDCGKLFSNTRMSRHTLVHSGEKKHECSLCHKRFSRKTTLKEHMKIHNNDKRWSCVLCSQCFVQKCSLKNHIKVHHKEYCDIEKMMCYTPSSPGSDRITIPAKLTNTYTKVYIPNQNG